MLKKIALVVLVLVAALLGYASTRPDTIDVTRTGIVHAKPEVVYPLVVDLHNWTKWSPWEELDPQMKRTFSGPESGVGAAYAWEGNSKVGKGSMEVTEASAPSKITMKLDFLEPMEGHNQIEFQFTPSGDDTQVSWRMHGPANFMAKLFGVFMNMDKMIGNDFEKGLAKLDTVAKG